MGGQSSVGLSCSPRNAGGRTPLLLTSLEHIEMYQLRYFFDAGSGICLWATNAEAIHKFGYPIDLSALPLTGETISQGRALIVRFDTSIVWHDPTAPSPWSVAEGVDFQRDSNAFLRLLRDELGAEFDVLSAQCALGEATQTISA